MMLTCVTLSASGRHQMHDPEFRRKYRALTRTPPDWEFVESKGLTAEVAGIAAQPDERRKSQGTGKHPSRRDVGPPQNRTRAGARGLFGMGKSRASTR
jgi:hypothetical protein